ncbi:response regulator receiver modulated FAD-dependent pyridine nucleotide-disulphide oxidoreductase [Fibrisoma limi BUZ 3]|uniref:Response regulator receiver modulated FAD-dependent pyridine nucleotide-disulphide oxidoreductase n=1 Tax=Fibrisoma limi BUZ 3 TaxID=1185876 RepID=I2GC50_9BACT|nr:FAD-dependent oxidoreductase [Fibrisoma limi]CCH51474.1 response regulator receiver modulated FAD-dependent pyridine nucleotide-disulphide oxidoreductase [Fibrisoma limi BUZ 3]
MKLPIILSIDDDPQVLQAVQQDLRKQYRKQYRVICTTSAQEALDSLTELKKKGEVVAMFLSDQRMPGMAGVDFLTKARVIYPEAKRALLTAYSDIDAAVRAINEVQLDYYIAKPWDPPEEKLYPVLDDLLSDWQSNHKPDFEGLRLIGYQFSPRSHELKDFLAGNLFPYQWLDIETDPKAQELLDLHSVERKDIPAVVLEDGTILLQPSLSELGEKLGLKPKAMESLYDLAIIGAGPAGLAAAVYGGSEGLKTILIDKRAPGGQAGTSSRIENYLGFPSGLSGADLARRAITQAQRFGVEFLAPQEVVEISSQGQYKHIRMADGSEVLTRAILLSTGVSYHKLENESLDKFTGAGVYYGAATTEAYAFKGQPVYIVGGGNSAGQGAMYLSRTASEVFICIRRSSLSETMSQYLIDQIEKTPNITLLPCTEVVEGLGNERLECLVLEDMNTNERRTVKAGGLFIFIGAKPLTDWIEMDIIKDNRGFIETGRGLARYDDFKKSWKLNREPYALETCSAGIFAAGDVRAGAMNRVASAVGEGAMAVSFVHKYLAEN